MQVSNSHHNHFGFNISPIPPAKRYLKSSCLTNNHNFSFTSQGLIFTHTKAYRYCIIFAKCLLFFRARNTDQNLQCNQHKTISMNFTGYQKSGEDVIRSQEAPISTAFSPPHHLFHNLNTFTHALIRDSHFLKVIIF